jgi:DNA-directed RNA polymerase specialized sigma24 family protein
MMHLPSTQIVLLKNILEDFEITIELNNQIMSRLYTFIFDSSGSSIYFEDSNLMDTALALKEIVDMEQLTNLEGIIDFFKGEDRAIDEFAADIHVEVERLVEKAIRKEEDETYIWSDDFFLTTTTIATRPALSRFVVGPSQSKNEQFQEIYKEQKLALRKMISSKLNAASIDQSYYMEDILQQAILDTLVTFKESAYLPSNVKKLLFEKARKAVEQVCKYEERKSHTQIEKLENELIDEPRENFSEELWLLYHFLAELPEFRKKILLLRMQGLSTKEIAELTGRHVSSIVSILHVTYRYLRKEYEKVTIRD